MLCITFIWDKFLLIYFNCTLSTINKSTSSHLKQSQSLDNDPLRQQRHRLFSATSSDKRGVTIVVATVSSSAISPSYRDLRELVSLYKLSLNFLSDSSNALSVAFSSSILLMIDSMYCLSGVGCVNKIGTLFRLDINRKMEFIPPLSMTKERRCGMCRASSFV